MLRRGCRAVIVSLAVVVAACGGGVQGTPVAVPAGGLDSVLLDAVDLDALLGTKGIQSEPDRAAMTDELATGTQPPGCVGTVRTAESNVYRDAGSTAVLTRVASEPVREGDSVDQSVVVVGSPTQAQHLLEIAKLSWSACAGATITQRGDARATWVPAPVAVSDGIVSQMSKNSAHGRCQHAMGAAEARVVEALVCGEDISDQAVRVVTEMIANAHAS